MLIHDDDFNGQIVFFQEGFRYYVSYLSGEHSNLVESNDGFRKKSFFRKKIVRYEKRSKTKTQTGKTKS